MKVKLMIIALLILLCLIAGAWISTASPHSGASNAIVDGHFARGASAPGNALLDLTLGITEAGYLFLMGLGFVLLSWALGNQRFSRSGGQV
jgi:hypothetical protein